LDSIEQIPFRLPMSYQEYVGGVIAHHYIET